MTKTHSNVLQRSLDALDTALSQTTTEELQEYATVNGNVYTVDVVTTLTLNAASHRDAEYVAEAFTQHGLDSICGSDTEVIEAEFALSTVTLKKQG